ncbi:HAMP domain-containing sensor histidine kinase [Clostridium transplantifaecale]|uniref:HAMP domain-containing sensor histidine kinase n=1 Tax=Clostridium transplantifaecale TaxID=2479838 RepID=UPI000F6363F8|nr:HAMP domain-containing sensor histidine kinase [Clostridium transplantifaecale]
MIRKRWLFLALILYLFLGGMVLHSLTAEIRETPVDMVAINRIVRGTADAWESRKFEVPGGLSEEDGISYDYAVLDNRGTLLFATSAAAPSSVHDAVSNHQTVLNIENGGGVVGKVLIRTSYGELLSKSRRQLITAALFFLALIAVPAGLYFLYLNRRVIRPFLELKDFARHVAAGNLDFPLPMDRGHIFGAFTESFDLMREQLREARQREAEADRSKKELIASLSHDIKTPVASIKLVSELLLATEAEGKTKDKIGTIYEKAGQIDRLVTNLFQASLEDLGKMTVNPAEESSELLAPMIQSADYCEQVRLDPVPGCLLFMDTLRISQVIDNIIHNSYKYADTAIHVSSTMTGSGLSLIFRDFGKGVPDEELPFLFQKYYRGSRQAEEKTEGSGLGLYISRLLMEQMGGDIKCRNLKDGFAVEVLIPFAGAS